jgi:hypothetical protein
MKSEVTQVTKLHQLTPPNLPIKKMLHGVTFADEPKVTKLHWLNQFSLL